MRPARFFAVAALLTVSLPLFSMTYYVLRLRGGSRLHALDEPVRKGRLLLFHRYPDGVFISLEAAEVENIVPEQEAPKGEALEPGQTLFIGPAVEGPRFEALPPAPAPPEMVVEPSWGYSGWWWGGGVVLPRTPVPPLVPSRIGPNGFPILAPPGSPGSAPPPIGPNGFPILAPQPPR